MIKVTYFVCEKTWQYEGVIHKHRTDVIKHLHTYILFFIIYHWCFFNDLVKYLVFLDPFLKYFSKSQHSLVK